MTTTISKQEFGEYLNNFDFKTLFVSQGWNIDRTKLPPIEENDELFTFNIEAEKQDFKIISCRSENGTMPLYSIRRKLENKIKALQYEHILVFCSEKTGEQVWLYTYRVGDKNKVAEIKYNINQDPERIYQKASGLIFELDEEDKITISDVKLRVNSNFAVNSEKVTKKFYVEFSKQHTNFVKLIEGISDNTEKEWYASIMLNRLMFCYFIQKRRFFDDDINYLRNKLELIANQNGNDLFYSFYKKFLTTLFHKGLAEPLSKRDKETQSMIGNIPYLNGGIFEIHEIEQKNKNIQIPDKAFENIFKLFDQYEWHLDTRECATGNEISPDVLGYIFEKYINDRAQMGAYYTQEDITEYISRCSIIPFLFNAVGKRLPNLFEAGSEISQMLCNSGDKYIFDAVKKGAELDFPDYIKEGIDTTKPNLLERRKRRNEPACEEFALPTEIWRETVGRLTRYKEIKNKIANSEITSIEDFITCHLDICSFAKDLLDQTQSPQFISYFYQALKKITVLDPTCGSGAFLFAALNILEDLYDSCLSRMEEFISSGLKIEDKQTRRLFEDELECLEKHDNKQYYIYKSIILNNLYGVDIMKEATETAKLRLFLKLISTAEPNYYKDNLGIEPLPDIDFNIRCGNSLVGYATKDEIKKGLLENFDANFLTAEVFERINNLSSKTHRFKDMQMNSDSKTEELKEQKKALVEARNALNKILDETLFKAQPSNKNTIPFHWYSEFYSIMDKDDGNGGFDVVIGNPPYVEYSKIKDYNLYNYNTLKCGNLYAYVVEKSLFLSNNKTFIGFIVPISLPATPRMSLLRKQIQDYSENIWISNFADRPATIFNGVHQKVSICLFNKSIDKNYKLFTTNFYHWYSKGCRNERTYIMNNIEYVKNELKIVNWAKCSNIHLINIIKKLLKNSKSILEEQKITNKHFAYLNMRMMLWTKCFINPKQSKEYKLFNFPSDNIRNIFVSVFNSSLHFLIWEAISDCWHITNQELQFFKIDLNSEKLFPLVSMANQLENDLENKKRFVGSVQTDYEYLHKKSKPIIDEIDKVLAQHYGFTEEELDYIINYDIKYRMGNELDDNE